MAWPALARHWLQHAQAELMYAQHWPWTLRRLRQGHRPGPMLSMHELSLSMPEPKPYTCIGQAVVTELCYQNGLNTFYSGKCLDTFQWEICVMSWSVHNQSPVLART